MEQWWTGVLGWLGTFQVGTVGEWVAGVIAGAALWVTVGTQRRQLDESARAEALELQTRLRFTLIEEPELNTVFILTMLNDGPRSKRNINVRLGPSGVTEGWKRIGFRAHVGVEDKDARIESVADDLGVGIWRRINLIGAGETVIVKIYSRGDVDRELYVLFTDSKGRRWYLDPKIGEPRRAKSINEEKQGEQQAVVRLERPARKRLN
ncbi:hypothetical protein [Rathayibacter sp. Leaf248]|uniref:hypothetical protein n=1 Tax=Rathayibacter sp. Leaf248 TaxID=2876555 RepID=UPI001E4068C4|nr:hypothetical protein [Rathayibacter sp. Leaf248]